MEEKKILGNELSDDELDQAAGGVACASCQRIGAVSANKAPISASVQGINAAATQGINAAATQGINAAATQGINAAAAQGINAAATQGINAAATQGHVSVSDTEGINANDII